MRGNDPLFFDTLLFSMTERIKQPILLTIDLQVPAILYGGEGEMRKFSLTSDNIAIILLPGCYPEGAHCHVTVRTCLQS